MSESNITSIINKVWMQLEEDEHFITPDTQRGIPFELTTIDTRHIIIRTNNGSGTAVSITKNAFIAALDYLKTHNHTKNNRCEIDSNNNPRLAGPLCTASRQENNNIRCINYILPILKRFNLVDIDGSRKNTTWLI